MDMSELLAARGAGLNTSASQVDQARILDNLVHNLQGMAYRCLNDSEWSMIFVSQGCHDLTGYYPEELLPGGSITWERMTHPDDRGPVRARITSHFAVGRRFDVQYRIVTRTGQVRWVAERGIVVADERGRPVIEGFVEDVTERRATIMALAQAEQRYRHIFEHASEGIFQSSKEEGYLAANLALARMYGFESPEALISNLSDIGHGLYVDPAQRTLFVELMETQGKVEDFESEVYRRDGSRIWISENARAVRDAQGRIICYEGTVHDITERKRYQEELERQANHDQLTGLPNRNLLNDRLSQAIFHADRHAQMMAVVFIDLDNFKFINDTLGHAAGDELLVEVGRRLSTHLRSADTVARQGGDEFVLVLNEHQTPDTVISLLERMVDLIGQPIMLGGRELQVGASMGVALYPQDGRDAETLLKHADVAMYAAKGHGKNNYKFFTPEFNAVASERMHLEAAMRVGLEQGEFTVNFQPKVDHLRRIVGVEALARWQHPEMGAISPDRFIPVAEESGLIMQLTEVIARQAFAAASTWPRVRGRLLPVAVNLSPKLFMDRQIVDRVHSWIDSEGILPEQVELEITESIFLHDQQRAQHILKAFKDLGVSLAMDDFGTGYSALSYLRHYPLDTIKIDRSLVVDIETREDAAMIARAVVSLGKSLRKTVVAEGVENPAQFDFLRFQGCDEFQGYLFSRPLTAEAIHGLLLDTRGQITQA